MAESVLDRLLLKTPIEKLRSLRADIAKEVAAAEERLAELRADYERVDAVFATRTHRTDTQGGSRVPLRGRAASADTPAARPPGPKVDE